MGSAARRHDRAPLWRLLLALVIGGVLAVLLVQRERARAIAAREEAALAVCRRVAAAQAQQRERVGRFGWWEELSGLPSRAQAAPGYRLDVLLPTGHGPLGEVLLAPPGERGYDPLLVARHWAVVARPEEPGVSGWRTYYLDETGRVFVSEGVADEESAAENALPTTRVERPRQPEQPGPVWRLLDKLND